MMKVRNPAEVFPPGEFIREELDARGWNQNDLAEILGRPTRLVNEIVLGKRAISPRTAMGLGEAFGTSPQFWMNLESAYQLGREKHREGTVARRAKLYEMAPIKEMVRRQWIEDSSSIEVLEQHLCQFFGIESLADEPTFSAAARKSTSYREYTPAQRAWLFRARQLAKAVQAASFEESHSDKLLEDLHLLLSSVEEVRRIPKLLAEAGIRFLVVEALQHTRIDGACFWMDARTPVVVLSLRYDRIDHLWYTLMHEVAHVKNRDGLDRGPSLDIDLVGEHRTDEEERPSFERKADRFAEEYLIADSNYQDFVRRVRPLYSKLKIQGFAALHHIHPGIVVGRLQFHREIPYAHSRDLLAKCRAIIMQSALTDGWGQSPRV
jgi:HTH-type transcriptional regulator/antitoxin HigA